MIWSCAAVSSASIARELLGRGLPQGGGLLQPGFAARSPPSSAARRRWRRRSFSARRSASARSALASRLLGGRGPPSARRRASGRVATGCAHTGHGSPGDSVPANSWAISACRAWRGRRAPPRSRRPPPPAFVGPGERFLGLGSIPRRRSTAPASRRAAVRARSGVGGLARPRGRRLRRLLHQSLERAEAARDRPGARGPRTSVGVGESRRSLRLVPRPPSSVRPCLAASRGGVEHGVDRVAGSEAVGDPSQSSIRAARPRPHPDRAAASWAASASTRAARPRGLQPGARPSARRARAPPRAVARLRRCRLALVARTLRGPSSPGRAGARRRACAASNRSKPNTPFRTSSRRRRCAFRKSVNRFCASSTERQNVSKSMPSSCVDALVDGAFRVTTSRTSASGSSVGQLLELMPGLALARSARTARQTWPSTSNDELDVRTGRPAGGSATSCRRSTPASCRTARTRPHRGSRTSPRRSGRRCRPADVRANRTWSARGRSGTPRA